MSSSVLSYYGTGISSTVLSGIGILPLAILWFISFCVARRKGDLARVGVTWMKVVYPFWLLALFFFTVRNALDLWALFDGYDYPVTFREISLAISHLGATAIFFKHLADTFLFITFVELANGFMLCVQGPGEPSKIRKFSRIAAFAWAFVLVAVALGFFGATNAHLVRFRELIDSSRGNDDESLFREGERLNREGERLSRLQQALTILFWLTTIPAIVLASIAQHKARLHGILSSTASLLLAATVLTFVRQLATMAIHVQVIVRPEVELIVKPIFDFILMMVVLILLFALAARKRRGLWLQPLPESSYPAVVYVGPDGQPVQGVPTMQQQQQYQYQQAPVQQQQQPGAMPAYLQFAEQQKQEKQQAGV